MNARRQDAAPVIEWSVDPADGPLQGPLALAFLHGRTLSLALRNGQVALLLDNGRLRKVLPGGRHVFPVGSRPGDVDARWHLLFLSTADGLVSRWTGESPLRCGRDLTLVGTCRADITDPAAFHGTFLAGVTSVDPAFVLVLVDRLLQAAVASRLAIPAGQATDRPEDALQARLAALRPADLAADLDPCGLRCRDLAVSAAQAPSELARSVAVPAAAAAPSPLSGHSEDLRRH